MGIIKCLMATGSNVDPIHNDDWCDTVILELGKEYTLEELVSLARCGDGDAIWVYEGEDWEDKENAMGKNMELLNGGVRYGQKFNPWDTDNIKLVRKATEDGDDDDWMEDWRREIAMEAGMMGGCEAYNEVMGY
tara:strand:- start:522 stop:923 length:402 start_codon:yes stop_codon:yes gene_type:complete